jgi:hypothetical protein
MSAPASTATEFGEGRPASGLDPHDARYALGATRVSAVRDVALATASPVAASLGFRTGMRDPAGEAGLFTVGRAGSPDGEGGGVPKHKHSGDGETRVDAEGAPSAPLANTNAKPKALATNVRARRSEPG